MRSPLVFSAQRSALPGLREASAPFDLHPFIPDYVCRARSNTASGMTSTIAIWLSHPIRNSRLTLVA